MNNKWKSMMMIKETNQLGGWTALPSVLWTHKKELGLSNDHIVFLLEILSHDEGYIIYDTLMSSATRSSLYRYRKYLKEKGYLDYPETFTKTINGKCSQTGFKYNLDGLLQKLVFLVENQYQSDTAQCQSGTAQYQSDTSQYPDEPLINNLPKESSSSNNNNQTTIIDERGQSSSSASGATTSNCTIDLTEVQKHILDSFIALNPEVHIRPVDLKNLSQSSIRIDSYNLKYWSMFCKQDKWLKDSDMSLTLFINNQVKLSSYIKSLPEEVKEYTIIWETEEDLKELETEEYQIEKVKGGWTHYPDLNTYYYVHRITGNYLHMTNGYDEPEDYIQEAIEEIEQKIGYKKNSAESWFRVCQQDPDNRRAWKKYRFYDIALDWLKYDVDPMDFN